MITTYSYDNIAQKDEKKKGNSQGKDPSRFSDLQGELVYIKAGADPYNNAVNYSNMTEQRYDIAGIMPDGFDDTIGDRNAEMKKDPKNDAAWIAPRKEELEEYLDASSSQMDRQKMALPTNNRRLGTRSLFWPPPDLEEDKNRKSYAQYASSASFDEQADKALQKSRFY
jgi:hypothetical protein